MPLYSLRVKYIFSTQRSPRHQTVGGEIKWSYTDDNGDTICKSLDLDTANEFLEIKDFGRSALDVQKLPEAVGIE